MPALTARTRRKPAQPNSYSFTLLLAGADPLSHLDTLFEAGCDDAIFGSRQGTYFADFDREASTLGEAVRTAIEQVERAVPGLQVVRVEPDDLVNAAMIAARTGRTRESIRLLIEHRRGPGNFPQPVSWVGAKTRLWRWSDVARWFADYLGERNGPAEEATFIASLNALLDLRSRAVAVNTPEERRVLAALISQVSELLGGR
jgi:predicted DNA-binding transcriptional regulator AlpA